MSILNMTRFWIFFMTQTEVIMAALMSSELATIVPMWIAAVIVILFGWRPLVEDQEVAD